MWLANYNPLWHRALYWAWVWVHPTSWASAGTHHPLRGLWDGDEGGAPVVPRLPVSWEGPSVAQSSSYRSGTGGLGRGGGRGLVVVVVVVMVGVETPLGVDRLLHWE